MKALDQLDLDILAHLFQDAGITNKDLAAKVGVAPSTCLERVRRLQNDNVLKGAYSDVDYKALGGHFQAMVAISLKQHNRDIVDNFTDAVVGLPEVINLYQIGGQRDILVHICVSDTDHLRNFVFDQFSTRDEVADIETSLVFEHLHSRTLPCFVSREK
ncbi:Lrp/AsnC family transcriptional regulator [Dongshaea marina]|uniref:Lrp/AsnC family transcriptional regulator n=1 Tax=Dongshaea marina TaxID=2047966 RepID=UPI000D3E4A37|nr:Lrp/AsnC family transcriptional regulator [Dongshaea marina]